MYMHKYEIVVWKIPALRQKQDIASYIYFNISA